MPTCTCLHGRVRLNRGVSLIEIVIVLAILGLLLLAAIPSVTDRIRNTQIRNAAESLLAGLQRARTEAITKNEAIRFSLVNTLDGGCVRSSTGTHYIVSYDEPSGNCDVEAGRLDVEPRILVKVSGKEGSAGAAVSAVQGDLASSASQVVFSPLGRLEPGLPGQIRRIEIASATTPEAYRRYRLEISALGGVRICQPTVTAIDDPRRCQT